MLTHHQIARCPFAGPAIPLVNNQHLFPVTGWQCQHDSCSSLEMFFQLTNHDRRRRAVDCQVLGEWRHHLSGKISLVRHEHRYRCRHEQCNILGMVELRCQLACRVYDNRSPRPDKGSVVQAVYDLEPRNHQGVLECHHKPITVCCCNYESY